MQKICSKCGAGREEYFYIYRPYSADEIIQGILDKIPGIDITTNTISGNKVQLIFRFNLDETQKEKLDNFLSSKGFVQDEAEELKQKNEEGEL